MNNLFDLFDKALCHSAIQKSTNKNKFQNISQRSQQENLQNNQIHQT